MLKECQATSPKCLQSRPREMQQGRDRSKGSVYQWEDKRFLKTKVRATKLNTAAAVLQRFFLQSRRQLRLFQEQQTMLIERLKEVETQRERELDSIAIEIEMRKNQIMKELQEGNKESHKEGSLESARETLAVAGTAIDEMTTEMKRYKKRNAFLQRRCGELRRDNAILRSDLKRAASLQVRLHKESVKLPAIIRTRMTALKQYQHRVAVYQTKYDQAEKQWQTAKLLNKHIRDCMSRIIQTMEENLQPETSDKLDLVDELYNLQRTTKWKRKCNAGVKTVKVHAEGGPKKSQASATAIGASRRLPSFPRNSPRTRAAARTQSST